MTPKVLILDDDPQRHKVFREILPNCLRYHAYTATTAIKHLVESSGPFDLVCLDHDLGDFGQEGEILEFGNCEAGTGVEVAQYISLHLERELYPQKIIIHSQNPVGAKRMYDTLFPTGIQITVLPFKV